MRHALDHVLTHSRLSIIDFNTTAASIDLSGAPLSLLARQSECQPKKFNLQWTTGSFWMGWSLILQSTQHQALFVSWATYVCHLPFVAQTDMSI